jgi:hypothetical protein
MNSDGYMDPIFISEAQSNGANTFEQKIDPHILEGALDITQRSGILANTFQS